MALDVLERFVGPRVIDLIVRGDERDIAVEDGVIARIAPEIGEPAREEVDARGCTCCRGRSTPRALQRPGPRRLGGLGDGTAALAAGGATACVEMPLNARPPTVDGAAFDAKLAAATGRAAVDFALWGGLVPGDLDRLDELAARGVVGFKAFMCDSGIDDFQAVDDDGLGAGMQRAAVLGLPVAVHAERPSRLRAPRGGSWREWAASRPRPPSCQPSSARSSSRGNRLLAARRPRLDREGSPRWPTRAGAASTPPARPARTTSCCAPPTWSGSARSPSARPAARRPRRAVGAARARDARRLRPLALPARHEGRRVRHRLGWDRRRADDLPLLLGRGCARGSARPPRRPRHRRARRFRLPGKGRLEVGADADLALVQVGGEHPVGELHDRHRANPFAGRRLGARVVRTLLRGHSGGTAVCSSPKKEPE